jgi:UDP-glucose 4-epimerase
MKILVTGGTGYIGSHTCVQLIEKGWQPVILDSLVNSKASVLDRIETITGHRPPFIQGDVREGDVVSAVLKEHAIEAVIHFAGLKAVGESVAEPLRYYDNNVHGSQLLLQAMQKCGVKTLVFSSSATVYGNSSAPPWNEQVPTSPANPYGRSKLLVDNMLARAAASDGTCAMTSLRYFNPVGAHPSGLMGEDPQGIPNNLMPFLAQVAVGHRDSLQVFGNQYPTADGTGIRDYLHVCDLASAHIAALTFAHGKPGHHIFNLGSGQGHSVLSMVKAFGKACGRELPYQFAPPRSGDLPAYWADPQLALNTLGWKAQKTIDDICQDTWRWQSQNPHGYP